MKTIATLFALFAASVIAAQSVYPDELDALIAERASCFPFGVASGDPRPDRVVLWTKLYLPQNVTSAEVTWVLSSDTLLAQVVASGRVLTNASSNHTVLVEPEALTPGTRYFYRFSLADTCFSPIGRTRTTPTHSDSLKFAVVSCAKYNDKFYNAYRLIAAREHLDAVIHLGDYIYEGGANPEAKRQHIPAHQLRSLNDYRSRYAQYRLDADLAEMHRLHPVIAIWDDHEFANDSYRDGAQNHRLKEAEWESRKAAAMQAYFEWLPVMTAESHTIVRSFDFSPLAGLFMIDGRLQRDPPIDDYNDPERFDTARTKLGAAQTARLTNWLRDAEIRWRIIGNNVMFAPMDLGKFAKERRWNTDAWDGFPANREQIFDTLARHNISNVVVLTGDIHTAWGLELARNPHDKKHYSRKTGAGSFGAEFVVQSVTSDNLDELVGGFIAKLANPYLKARRRNPHLRYANTSDHGYMLIDVQAEKVTSTWVFTRHPYRRTLKTKRPKSRTLHYNGRLMRK
jgi:alkaline phosphatase D